MNDYQLILDDGRSSELMVETIQAADDAEARRLGQVRLSALAEVQRIVVMRRSLEIATLERRH